MTLQVRLVHALGDSLIDLPEKTYEAPLVIGRASTADIQVPETTISRRHSLLYIHDGQWYIQDGNGGARTLVNGRPTPEPTPVHSGDVIVLGTEASAPRLTIDPYGLLVAGKPDEASAQTLGAVPPQPTGWAKQSLQGAEAPAEDWMIAPAGDAGSQRFYIPRQNTWSTGMIATVVLCGMGIIGGAIYIHSKRDQAARDEAEKANEAIRRQVVIVKATTRNIEEEQAALRRLAIQRAATQNNKPKVASIDTAAAQDPGRQTDEWLRVKEAHDAYKPELAVVVFSDYLKQFPSTPYAADLRGFTEDALDMIWWEHVVELAKERDDATKEIVGKNRDLAQSQDTDFKKTLQEEKAVWELKLQIAQDKLKEMNYLSEKQPNLNDKELMADLRQARDPVKYAEWKKGAEKILKNSRGQKSVW